jgi:hypothetical protein
MVQLAPLALSAALVQRWRVLHDLAAAWRAAHFLSTYSSVLLTQAASCRNVLLRLLVNLVRLIQSGPSAAGLPTALGKLTSGSLEQRAVDGQIFQMTGADRQ